MNKNLLVLTTAGTVKWLREAVDGLRDPLDVLVVDDATPSHEIADFCATKGLLFITKPEPKGLTHSWNLAYKFFSEGKYQNCILSNDDVRFPQGFSKGLLEGLKKFDLVGSLSNQPGHQPKQRLPESLLAKANPENIDEIQKELLKLFKDKPFEQLPYFNGFCFAFGKSIGRFMFSDNLLFNPENINIEQEADLSKRMQCSKGKVGMCKTSYVFHWKNVTLKNCGSNRQELWRKL